jgi:hypothetical protein
VIPTACQVRSVVVLPKHKEKKLIRARKADEVHLHFVNYNP